LATFNEKIINSDSLYAFNSIYWSKYFNHIFIVKFYISFKPDTCFGVGGLTRQEKYMSCYGRQIGIRNQSLIKTLRQEGPSYGSCIYSYTCAISVYHPQRYEFEPRSWQGVLDTTLCDKVCQWLATDQWFSPSTPITSTNITDRHDITEILLKMALNTINQSAFHLNIHIYHVLVRSFSKFWFYQ
jgi:hypothetical protein